MIYKFVFVCALISITASASAIKGREESLLEGGLKSPTEQHRLIEQHQNAAKTTKLESNAGLEESRQEQYHQKREEVPLVAEHRNEENNWREQSQQREEVEVKAPVGLKYEAKQQLSRDELSKVNNKFEQREELSKTNRFEQKQEVEKFDQQFSQQRDIDSSTLENHGQQVVEFKEEQRRIVDEQPALVQPILPLTLVEEPLRNTENLHALKGGAGYDTINQAPIGEAEPYAFSYNVDGSSRSESGDTKGVVRGQYTLSGADGMNRVVDYVADHNGFRASVNTNEFGTEAKSPASIALRSSQPLAEEITLRSEGKTRENLALTNNYASKGGFQQQRPVWSEENQQTSLIESSAEKKQPLQQQQQFVSLLQPSKISQKPLYASKGEPARKIPVAVEQFQAPIKQVSERNDARKVPLEQSYQAPLKQIAERSDSKKGLEEVKREPIKGLKEKHQEKEELLQQQENVSLSPAKSAEIRAPKTLQNGFESASAHRVYRQPVNYVSQVAPLRAVAPGVHVRAYPPPAPVVRGPAPLVYRPNVSHVHGRYPPPSPVQGYRRAHRYESVVPTNPRVSFYGSNFDEDHASFEHPDS